MKRLALLLALSIPSGYIAARQSCGARDVTADACPTCCPTCNPCKPDCLIAGSFSFGAVVNATPGPITGQTGCNFVVMPTANVGEYRVSLKIPFCRPMIVVASGNVATPFLVGGTTGVTTNSFTLNSNTTSAGTINFFAFPSGNI